MWQPVTDIQDIRQPTEEDKGEGSPFISEEAFDWLDLFIDGCDKGCCNPEALKFIPLDKAPMTRSSLGAIAGRCGCGGLARRAAPGRVANPASPGPACRRLV